MKRHKLFTRILCTAILAAVSPSFASASGFTGSWTTSENDFTVSLTPCKKDITRMCGYLIQFESTGDAAIDKQFCQLQIIGDMQKIGDTLKNGWFLNIEDEQVYSLSVYTKNTDSLRLRIFEKKESDGQDVTFVPQKSSVNHCSKT